MITGRIQDGGVTGYTKRGTFVRYDRPSAGVVLRLINNALASSSDVLVQGPDEPVEATDGLVCKSIGPCNWRLDARPGDAAIISKWLYLGNWCLFIGGGKGLPRPFSFSNLEGVLDELFESVGASAGIVAFHDNTAVWAYARTTEPFNVE